MGALRPLIVVAALVAVSCGGSPSVETSTTSGGGGTTTTTVPGIVESDAGLTGRSAELAALRVANEGRLPLEAALDLFAAAFGPVPGADPERFEARPGDGTMALAAVGAHWDALTAEQQQAVQAHLGYSGVQSLRTPLAQPDATTLQARVDAARATIASRVGGDVSFPIVAEVAPGLEDLGVAVSERGGRFVTTGRPELCRLQFSDSPPVPSDSTVAHEVFHCFQYHLVPDLREFFTAQQWIYEGSAVWAETELAGIDDQVWEWFADWVFNTGSVFGLDYAGVGFFWTVESMGVSPWSVIGDMLVAGGGVDAVAATGLDPGDVLNRIATSLARRSMAPALAVSAAWDFAVEVPPLGIRTAVTVTPARPFEGRLTRSGYSRGGILVLTLEGGDRVEVTVDADVGTLEFIGHDPVQWEGGLHQEFCLEEGGCRCGVDGAVDPGFGDGSRRVVIGSGELGGGPITVVVRIPGDGAFTDGHWTGTITSSAVVLTVDSATVTRHEATSPFEFTIEDGAVTSGTFAFSFYAEVEADGGRGQGWATETGALFGCGFAPQLFALNFGFEGTIVMEDISFPLRFEFPIDDTGGPGVVWGFDPVTDPDRRTGAFEPSAAGIEIVRASGLGVSEIVFTFEATRTG